MPSAREWQAALAARAPAPLSQTCTLLNAYNYASLCSASASLRPLPEVRALLNRPLVFVGDSIASQIFGALACLGGKETGGGDWAAKRNWTFRWMPRYNRERLEAILASATPNATLVLHVGAHYRDNDAKDAAQSFPSFPYRSAIRELVAHLRADGRPGLLASVAAQHWHGGIYNKLTLFRCLRRELPMPCGPANSSERLLPYRATLTRLLGSPSLHLNQLGLFDLFGLTRRWAGAHPGWEPNHHSKICDCAPAPPPPPSQHYPSAIDRPSDAPPLSGRTADAH